MIIGSGTVEEGTSIRPEDDSTPIIGYETAPDPIGNDLVLVPNVQSQGSVSVDASDIMAATASAGATARSAIISQSSDFPAVDIGASLTIVADVRGTPGAGNNDIPAPPVPSAASPSIPVVEQTAAQAQPSTATGATDTARPTTDQFTGTATGALPVTGQLIIHEMTFNVTFESSVTSQSNFTTIEDGFARAVVLFANQFYNPITINLVVGWGDISNGGSLQGALGLSQATEQAFSYSTIYGALASHQNSTDDKTAFASVPTTNPNPGHNTYMPTGEAKALGLIDIGATAIDGYLGFDSSASWTFNNDAVGGAYDFVGAALHEITHALGRQSGLQNSGHFWPLDLFRWNGPGDPALALSGSPYFSIDGGVTSIKQYDTTSDPSDWSGSSNDAFDAVVSQNEKLFFTSADLTEMDVLGFDRSPTQTVTGTLSQTLYLDTPSETIASNAQISGFDRGVYGVAGYPWQVTNYGVVQGSTSGILLETGGVISNFGTVAATSGFAGYGVNLAAGGTLVNYGTVGGLGGVGVFNGFGYITNHATITGAAGAGIYANATAEVTNLGTRGNLPALITGAKYGVDLAAGGSVTNGAAFPVEIIEGTNAGVRIRGASGTVHNYGTITATATSGNNFAIELSAGGAVRNSGLVNGRQGVVIFNGAGTFNNYGTILGSRYNGVYAQLSSTLFNIGHTLTTGALIDGQIGVNFNSGGQIINGQGGVYNEIIRGADIGVLVLGASGTVVNVGTITSTATSGNHYGIKLANGGYLLNFRGQVTGRQGVVIFNGAGSINNYATIAGSGYNGAYSQATATVSNEVSGIITGPVGLNLHGGGSLFNTGTIKGASYGIKTGVASVITNAGSGLIEGDARQGVQLNGGGMIVNNATGATSGRIAGGYGILTTGASANIINSGTIAGTGTSGFGFGINLAAGGTISNSRLITGRTGVGLFNGSGTVINYGTISGVAGYGILASVGNSLITNASTGLIQGDATSGYAWGINLSAGGKIANGGQITGRNGIGIFNTAGTVINFGRIIGSVASGVQLSVAGATVTNTATGRVEGFYGVNASGSSVNISNFGTIASTGTGASGGGVKLTGFGQGLSNDGLISGATGVYLGGYIDMITNLGQITGRSAVFIADSGNALINSGGLQGTLFGVKETLNKA